jgi:thermostable 8-oxoguanine DNA glycosylase
MSTTSEPVMPRTKLDEKRYDLSPNEAAFFKKETGIDDDEVLKRHILALQAEAYNVRDFGAPSDSF